MLGAISKFHYSQISVLILMFLFPAQRTVYQHPVGSSCWTSSCCIVNYSQNTAYHHSEIPNSRWATYYYTYIHICVPELQLACLSRNTFKYADIHSYICHLGLLKLFWCLVIHIRLLMYLIWLMQAYLVFCRSQSEALEFIPQAHRCTFSQNSLDVPDRHK